MKKIAIVSVLACVSALALAGLGSFRSEARAAAPVAVAPVALPPVVDFAPLAITLPETTIAATPKARKAPKAVKVETPKTLVCGEPLSLLSDYQATARRCEWR